MPQLPAGGQTFVPIGTGIVHHNVDTPGLCQGRLHLLAGPERIESGWWDGADVRRDYHTIEWHNARAWVFREHASGRWYLHGWFA